jgi:hypothetical protein
MASMMDHHKVQFAAQCNPVQLRIQQMAKVRANHCYPAGSTCKQSLSKPLPATGTAAADGGNQ